MATTAWQLHHFKKKPQLRVDCRPGTCLDTGNARLRKVLGVQPREQEAFSIILKLVPGAPGSSPEILCHRNHVLKVTCLGSCPRPHLTPLLPTLPSCEAKVIKVE